MANEFGDYQTPDGLVSKVISLLKSDGVSPEHIIEPTFGQGHFIKGALSGFDHVKQISGFEIQNDYFNKTVEDLRDIHNVKFNLIHGSFFDQDLSSLFDSRSTLVLGNPPWVTSSELSTLNSANVPKKVNFKNLSGFDALTGKSNFDIAEYISIKLLDALSHKQGPSVLAFLVKNIVPQNLLREMRFSDLRICKMRLYRFNAKREFGVSADASLMLINVDPDKDQTLEAEVYDLNSPDKLIVRFGWDSGNFVSNISAYDAVKYIDSKSSYVWRSGIKHDASKVMELLKTPSLPVNGFSESVDIEDGLIYDIIKSSDIRKSLDHTSSRKLVIVTQRKIGDDTSWIESHYPKTWQYLLLHSDKLDGRKSSIYKGKPRFSIFGVGDYSFAPYKVAISGMYKDPVFSLIERNSEKPIMVDDTVYFLPFENKEQALIALATLNGSEVQKLLSALAFKDAKRPYTKDVLMRIDIQNATRNMGIAKINDYLTNKFHELVNVDSFNEFIAPVESNNNKSVSEIQKNYSTIELF
jgi:hypothetical protein